MARFSELIEVADVTALKAVNAADKTKRYLKDRGDSLGGWYRYDITSTTTEKIPYVVAPDNGVGRWIATGESQEVADITALKALTSSVDGVRRVVADTGSGKPGIYRYNSTATDTENLPSIVSPTSGTGRWFLMGGTSEGGAASTAGSIPVHTVGAGTAPHFNGIPPTAQGDIYMYLSIDPYGNTTGCLVFGVDPSGLGASTTSGWMFGPDFNMSTSIS